MTQLATVSSTRALVLFNEPPTPEAYWTGRRGNYESSFILTMGAQHGLTLDIEPSTLATELSRYPDMICIGPHMQPAVNGLMGKL